MRSGEGCNLQSGGAVICRVKGVSLVVSGHVSYSGGGGHILKWRGCILRSGGAVICKVEGVSKWWGVFYILQGTCYI